MLLQLHEVAKPVKKDGKEEPVVYPQDANCFLAASNGLFRQIDNPFYVVRQKVEGIALLGKAEELVRLKVSRIPFKLFQQVEEFFSKVYDKHKSEAAVVLMTHPVSRVWAYLIPKQVVAGASAKYKLYEGDLICVMLDPADEVVSFTCQLANKPACLADFEMFGTIHSHADFSAFHSGTDNSDEFGFDGLHITIGNVNQPNKSYSCRWILSGKEYKADLRGVVEMPPGPEIDMTWLGQVEEPPKIVYQGGVYGDGYWDEHTRWGLGEHRSGAGDDKEKKDWPAGSGNSTSDSGTSSLRAGGAADLAEPGWLHKLRETPLHGISDSEQLLLEFVEEYPEVLQFIADEDEARALTEMEPMVLHNHLLEWSWELEAAAIEEEESLEPRTDTKPPKTDSIKQLPPPIDISGLTKEEIKTWEK